MRLYKRLIRPAVVVYLQRIGPVSQHLLYHDAPMYTNNRGGIMLKI